MGLVETKTSSIAGLENKIRQHLAQQYEGIFLPTRIEGHINEYIQESQSNYLIEKVKPLITKGAKILDVGSGYGSFVLSALANGYDAYGIELEAFEHEISKERAQAESVDSNRFTCGSALELPYPDGNFDVVTFWNVLEHVSDYKQTLREAKRVLKPGGMIFIIAPNYFAFRQEAHYHLPWLPLFPKPLARIYLKAMGRKTTFLDNCIFYITMYGIKRFINSEGMTVSIDVNEKIAEKYQFQSQKVNRLVAFCEKFKVIPLLMRTIFLIKTHPLAPSIDLIAKKND